MSLLNGPNDGNWAVFAEKVVAERDAAREIVVKLREALNDRVKHCRNPRCTARTWRELGDSPCVLCESDAELLEETGK